MNKQDFLTLMNIEWHITNHKIFDRSIFFYSLRTNASENSIYSNDIPIFSFYAEENSKSIAQ